MFLEFLRENWVLITFCASEVGIIYGLVRLLIKTAKCTLRNDILSIYDKCKESKQITEFQLQSITYSYDVYKKLKGNSFIDTIVLKKIPEFDVVEKENDDEN